MRAAATARSAGPWRSPSQAEWRVRAVDLAGPEVRSFEDYRNGLIHDWTKTLSALGFCLIPMFLVLDYFTMPRELLYRFAVYRAAGTVFALAQHFFIRHTRPTRWSLLHGYAFSLMVGGMIVLMTYDLGGFDSSYYAGLSLVVVASNLLLPWRAMHSAVNGTLVLVMYVVLNGVWGGPFQTSTLINNLYFLSATVVIAVAINFVKYRLIEQEFRLRAELLDVNDSLDRSRLELKSARDALWGEMEMAKRIQTALLPKNRRLGGYQVAAMMLPADEVGGDYYEMIETRDGEHWVAIGDVSGHGVESGLVMMMTQTSILALVNDRPGRAPSEVCRAVNGALYENIARLQTNRFMTLSVVKLGPAWLTVAGKHQDLLVHRRRAGRVETVTNTGTWVGVLRDTSEHVNDLEVRLDEGDTVLLFTDGVTEATDGSGILFGQERLEALFARLATRPLPEILEALLSEVRAYQTEQRDDVTLMLLRRGET